MSARSGIFILELVTVRLQYIEVLDRFNIDRNLVIAVWSDKSETGLLVRFIRSRFVVNCKHLYKSGLQIVHGYNSFFRIIWIGKLTIVNHKIIFIVSIIVLNSDTNVIIGVLLIFNKKKKKEIEYLFLKAMNFTK